MAYPSNENTGAKNLVDFVVHLRDSEDALKQTITDAKASIAGSVNSATASKNAAAESAAAAAATLSSAESAIESKKAAALAEIPETYTDLSNSVGQLKDDMDDVKGLGLSVVNGKVCVTFAVQE